MGIVACKSFDFNCIPQNAHTCPCAPETIEYNDGVARVSLRVDHAPIHDSEGAIVSGFAVGDIVSVRDLRKLEGLEPLGWRYHDQIRSKWPRNHCFQDKRSSYMCAVTGRDQKEIPCVLQVADIENRSELFDSVAELSIERSRTHVDNAMTAADHASRFNMQMFQSLRINAGSLGRAQDEESANLPVPTVKVCAPVACEVMATSYANILPRGASCTITPYRFTEVHKFIFYGNGYDEYAEIPQAFFHYTAFVSRCEELLCDIQGHEGDVGCYELINPVVFTADKADISDIIFHHIMRSEPDARTIDRDKKQGESTFKEDRFDALHPRCGQLCQIFDPLRKGVRGQNGYCGTCLSKRFMNT